MEGSNLGFACVFGPLLGDQFYGFNLQLVGMTPRIEHFGKELYLCGKALMAYEKEKDRCAVELHTLSVFGVDLWIPSGLSVGRCYYNKKSKPGLKAGYLYCYPSGISYRPGSW